MIKVNGFRPLTITKRSVLDVAAVLDPPLMVCVRSTNNAWSEIKIRDTLLSQNRSVQAEVLLSL